MSIPNPLTLMTALFRATASTRPHSELIMPLLCIPFRHPQHIEDMYEYRLAPGAAALGRGLRGDPGLLGGGQLGGADPPAGGRGVGADRRAAPGVGDGQ